MILKFDDGFIKDLLIVAMAIALIMLGCNTCKKTDLQPTVSIKTDTLLLSHTDTVIRDVEKIKYVQVPPTIKIKDSIQKIIDSSSLNEIQLAYRSLAQDYYSLLNYVDTLNIDSLGYIAISDTITQNRIAGRGYRYNLKEKLITKTITIKEPTKPITQLYFGGGLFGQKSDLIKGGEVMLSLKTKSDKIIGIKAASDLSGNILYGLNFQFKIKL